MNVTNYLLIVSLLTQDAKVLFFLKVKWGAFWLCLFVLGLVFFDPLSTSCLTCPIWEIRFSLSFLWAAHSNESWCRSKWSASNDPSSLTQTADTALQSGPNLAHLQINSTFSFYMSGWLSLFCVFSLSDFFLLSSFFTQPSFSLPHSRCLWIGIYWSG